MMHTDNPADAFWGPSGSKANFCEEDYVVTRYVAEFINSLTNLSYIFYAVYGLHQLRHQRNVGFFRTSPYWGLMAVGICSAMFHISLQYHTQMLDDLSMLFTTTPLLHRVLTVNANQKDSFIAGLVIYSALLLLVLYHIMADELLFHATFFVGCIATIGIRTIQLLKQRTTRDSAVRRRIRGMVVFGAVIFHIGYFVWLMDGWVCDLLRNARAQIGLPWAWLLELHGWWHIFTAIGAYTFIAVIDQLVSGGNHQDIEKPFAWPLSWASKSIFADISSTLFEAGGKIP